MAGGGELATGSDYVRSVRAGRRLGYRMIFVGTGAKSRNPGADFHRNRLG